VRELADGAAVGALELRSIPVQTAVIVGVEEVRGPCWTPAIRRGGIANALNSQVDPALLVPM
jgi:hypothetical protein